MKLKLISITALSSLFLTGCFETFHHAAPNGNQINYKRPMLTKTETKGGTYILVEKNIADGKYKTISISKERQKIQNERQERIVFSEDLTKFSTDFEEYSWEQYSDSGNYGYVTYISRCTTPQKKTISYNPCSTDFKEVFIPTGITKAYVAGHISKSQKDRWEDPRQNPLYEPISPWQGIYESNAVYDIGVVKVTK